MTKVIALSGCANGGKTSLIQGHYDGSEKIRPGIAEVLQSQGARVKVYPEIARACYNILNDASIPEPRRMYEFQKSIHHLETLRVKQCIEEKEKDIYDVMIFDRTRYDNILYSLQNYKCGTIKEPDFFEDNPGRLFYDSVILLSQPMKDSLKKGFDIYGTKNFKKQFREQLQGYYRENTTVFKNSLIDRDDIIDHVTRTL